MRLLVGLVEGDIDDPDVEFKRDTKGEIITIFDYHVRCKGVSKGALEYETKQRGQTFLDLYIDMHDGVRIKFDLCAGKVRFDLKGFDYTTIEHFYRELSF